VARRKPDPWHGVGAPGVPSRDGKPGVPASAERAAVVAEIMPLWRADAFRRNVPPRWVDDFVQTAALYGLQAKPRGKPEEFRKHIFWFGSSRAWREHQRLRRSESEPQGWLLSPTRVVLAEFEDAPDEELHPLRQATRRKQRAALWTRKGVREDELHGTSGEELGDEAGAGEPGVGCDDLG